MSYHILIPAAVIRPVIRTMNRLKHVGALAARVWVAKIFLSAGLAKIAYWAGTVMTFKTQYSVPFMSPEVAAYLGTAAEFILPALLILGLGGRISIMCFFIYNLICIVSFHFLWTPAGAAGLADHISWGLLLFLIMVYGPGKISVDYWLHRKFGYLIHGSSWSDAKHQFHREKKQKQAKQTRKAK